MLPIRRILVPFDWSELSNRAFQIAASLAQVHDAQLIVLYVVPLPAVMYGPPNQAYLEHTREELCRMRPSDPAIRVQHYLCEGVPAAMILQMASDKKCDLIVMGMHGRTGLRRALVGSVTEEVVRKAPCPVLTMTTAVAVNLADQAKESEKVAEPAT